MRKWREIKEIEKCPECGSALLTHYNDSNIEARAVCEDCGHETPLLLSGNIKDDYPANWSDIATQIKDRADWKCERCGHSHDPGNGYCLTVHHLVPIKRLCEDWNLAALCQRCHLHMQHVNLFQEYYLPHSKWFIPHLRGFLDWWEREHIDE